MPERTIFLAALEKPPAERPAYLDAACGADADLRRRVEELLAAHEQAGSFLNRTPTDATGDYVPTPSTEHQGDRIGPYKLLQKLGEGGMGAVYLAEQREPVRRMVALKLIKPGMDSRSVLARFEAERQALALMDHPNIARVLDAGTTDTGRPFFVMELVKGVPITRYCDECRLTPRERLELFVPVCQAVQHAHQKGVIHRDLKPSNVLVALYDGRAVPKVIDFGVAKATGQKLTEQTLFTEVGAVVGTLEYMAPEQAELNNLDIDTRADVYALGVLLYELLTGSPPFSRRQLQQVAFSEMLRLIREVEPPRPSARLSSSAELPSLAAVRRLEPKRLARLVRGDLDWIVMKCLEKERGRRYDTANGLAHDIERYLADEPVAAGPPSAAYRLRKFVRRHRAGVAAGALVLLALLAGIAGMSWGLVQADQGRRAAEAAETAERAERAKADSARREAERTAASLLIDIDLAEYRRDPGHGLLRLARTLRGLPADLRELREFLVVATLAGGQDHAPLLPPITHDGQAVGPVMFSPDHQTLLTRGQDFTARLWDTRTARLIAVLRKANERVVKCGFSPDGRIVFTDDRGSVARFWDVPSGRYRAETESRPNRYAVPDSWLYRAGVQNMTHISENRLLTNRVVEVGDNDDVTGPVELWDTATGRSVARLDRPGRDVKQFQFLRNGHWVMTLEGQSTVLVFSAEDGRLLGRLTHNPAARVQDVFASPTGRRVGTLIYGGGKDKCLLQIWDTTSWQAEPLTTPLNRSYSPGFPEFLTDDVITVFEIPGAEIRALIVYRLGQTVPIAQFPGPWPYHSVGELRHMGNGQVFDTRNGQRLLPSAGRRFHPALARFAPDNRFVGATYVDNTERNSGLIDTRTDKYFPTRWGEFVTPHSYLPGFGVVIAMQNFGGELRLIPSADRLNIPPDLLELWAQVAVRGAIGPDGTFVKWDEPTWERRRQELAAKPAPYPDFPFPGRVATDKLHWLRAEFDAAEAAPDKLRLAGQLLRRAEEVGDRDEAVRWRGELARWLRLPLPW